MKRNKLAVFVLGAALLAPSAALWASAGDATAGTPATTTPKKSHHHGHHHKKSTAAAPATGATGAAPAAAPAK